MIDRFRQMQIFVAVADAESFAAAARRLASSPPAVTRAIASLEAALGVRLLDRTTRYVRPTEAGRSYLEDARRILAEVDAAEAALAGGTALPRGHLTVTAPVLFGRLFVMPVVVDYLRTYPETEISALFVDRVVNLLEEGVDVGLRIGDLPDSSLRALRVGAVRQVLCAAPAYFERNGRPRVPEDLSGHTLIASSAGSLRPGWRFGRARDARTLRVRPRLTVATNDAAIEAALSGFGIARLLSYQIAPQLAAGSLELVLEDAEPPALPVHVVHREGRLATPKVRTFVDLLADRLRAS